MWLAISLFFILVILLYAVGYRGEDAGPFTVPSTTSDLLRVLELPPPTQYTDLFVEFPAAKVFSERTLALFRSNCNE